jgi:opacity protein-like surface antigen
MIMQQHLGRWTVVTVCCGLVLGSATAARSQGYFNMGIGAALPEDVKVTALNGVGTPQGVKLDLDPGVRFSVAGGYNFHPYVGIEIESGFIYNSINGVVGPGGNVGTDASLSHVPIQANLVFRYDQPDCPVVPFAGVGAGGDLSILIDNSVEESDTKFVFAWQGFGGVRFKVNESMSVGAAYKYYNVQNTSFNLPSGSFAFGHEGIHSILVDFNWKF